MFWDEIKALLAQPDSQPGPWPGNKDDSLWQSVAGQLNFCNTESLEKYSRLVSDRAEIRKSFEQVSGMQFDKNLASPELVSFANIVMSHPELREVIVTANYIRNEIMRGDYLEHCIR